MEQLCCGLSEFVLCGQDTSFMSKLFSGMRNISGGRSARAIVPRHALSSFALNSRYGTWSYRFGYHVLSLKCCSAPSEFDDGGIADVEAMVQAQEVYTQAVQLSELQTRYEIETAWRTDSDTMQATSDEPVPTQQAVISLLTEYGLTDREANILHRALYPEDRQKDEDVKIFSLSQLSALLERWQRVLPGLSPAKLAASDSQLLRADVNQALLAVIFLVGSLPGRDVMSMIERLPRLLWTPDLEPKFITSKESLIRLHPSGDADIVMDLLVEHPELMFRMEYYRSVHMIDELPIEIQNMMVVADQGIGYTYRYYRNRKTDYKAELNSEEPFEQQT